MVHMLSLPHTSFAQIARPSNSRFVRVFQDNGAQILSVSTSTDAVYSGVTLTIKTSTSFFTNRMYYLLADSGVYACVACACMHAAGSTCCIRSLILSLITGRLVDVCRVDENLHVVL